MLKESESEDLKYRDKIDPRWPKNHKYWFTKTEFLVLQFGFYDSHHRAPAGVELYLGILTDFNLNFHLRFPQPCQVFQQTWFRASSYPEYLHHVTLSCFFLLYPIKSTKLEIPVLILKSQQISLLWKLLLDLNFQEVTKQLSNCWQMLTEIVNFKEILKLTITKTFVPIGSWSIFGILSFWSKHCIDIARSLHIWYTHCHCCTATRRLI